MRQPGGATVRPRTLCFSIRLATNPDAFTSSAKSRRKGGRSCILARGADRLLHRHEPSLEDAPAGHLRRVPDQRRPQPRQRLELVAHELLRRAGERIRTHQLGVLDVALQPEPVGRASHHGDAHARPVDIGDDLQRRVRRHQIRRLDLHVRRAERDLLRALRLGADQPDVPRIRLGRIGQLARVP